MDKEQIWLKTASGNILPHCIAYAYATQYVQNRKVADLCCGTGYGTKLLNEVGHAVGYDTDKEAIAYAKRDGRTTFYLQDVETADLSEYDVITCMQGLEHLDDPKALINKYKDKIWIFSLPFDQNDSNPYHHHRITTEVIHDWFGDCKVNYYDDCGNWTDKDGYYTNFFGVKL